MDGFSSSQVLVNAQNEWLARYELVQFAREKRARLGVVNVSQLFSSPKQPTFTLYSIRPLAPDSFLILFNTTTTFDNNCTD